jgi:hypothetical protein
MTKNYKSPRCDLKKEKKDFAAKYELNLFVCGRFRFFFKLFFKIISVFI